jgi:CBS domain-containing membrane protein
VTQTSDASSSARDVRARWKLFQPILVGATLRDRAIACVGAVLGVGLAGLISTLAVGGDAHLPLLAAPLGASAVLVFALPASPIAQPWPVIAGNTISALTGATVAYFVHDPMLAAGLAVGLAIAAMSLTRSLHPPGGGMALTAVIGGSSVAASGFAFALVPVCLNSALLVLLAWAFHKFSGHAYPRTAPPAPSGKPLSEPIQARAEDVDAAIEQMGETFDINRSDLDRLLFLVELNARKRDRSTS